MNKPHNYYNTNIIIIIGTCHLLLRLSRLSVREGVVLPSPVLSLGVVSLEWGALEGVEEEESAL